MPKHVLKLEMPSSSVIAGMSKQQIINLRRDLLSVHHSLCVKGKCICVLKSKKLPPIPR